MLERFLNVEPPSGVEVQELLDEVAKPALDDVDRRNDLLRDEKKEAMNSHQERMQKKRERRTSSVFIPFRNFFDPLSVWALG